MAPFLVTLPWSTPNQILIIEVTDANGNVTTDSAQLVLALSDCTLVFSGIPSSGILNQSDCLAPGCTSVDQEVTVLLAGDCGTVDTLALLQDRNTVDQVQLTGELSATFTLSIGTGDSFTLEGIGLSSGAAVASSGVTDIFADFVPPTVSFVAQEVEGFTTAASGSSVTYNMDSDQNGALAGMQFHVALQTDDPGGNLVGGSLVSLSADSGAGETIIDGGSLPATFDQAPSTNELKFLTVGDQATWTITATVEDFAGNVATTSFTANVDLQAPEEVILAPIAADAVGTRLPSVPLSWITPASNTDGTGEAIANFEVRYSLLPITSQASFDTACIATSIPGASAVPNPGPVGEENSYTVSGPDSRPAVQENGSPCKFAASTEGTVLLCRQGDRRRATSPDHGNGSTSTDAAVALRHLDPQIGDGEMLNTKYVAGVGDLNSDGLGDAVIGERERAGSWFMVMKRTVRQAMDDLVLTGASGTFHVHCNPAPLWAPPS